MHGSRVSIRRDGKSATTRNADREIKVDKQVFCVEAPRVRREKPKSVRFFTLKNTTTPSLVAQINHPRGGRINMLLFVRGPIQRCER